MKKILYILILVVIAVLIYCFYFLNIDTSVKTETFTLKLGESVTFDGLYSENIGGGMWATMADREALPISAPRLFIKPDNKDEGQEFGMAMTLYSDEENLTDDEKKAEAEMRKIIAFGYELILISTDVYPGGHQNLTFSITKSRP